MKAYRKHVREGTLAPVPLWWVSFLDGRLILDGHDRAAALAESVEPACVELARLPDEADWRRTAEEITAAHEERLRTWSPAPHSRTTGGNARHWSRPTAM
ncbi:hypothetical protein GCM10010377_57740 [Streptomyces viridiviolaceus]|nr:hypothetical protein GCM10010377_57740 [Streptomyces viridiviolaceus]